MNRIVEFGKQIWSLMTEDERMNFGQSDGTLYFIELIATCVYPTIDWDDIDLINRIHDEIFS